MRVFFLINSLCLPTDLRMFFLLFCFGFLIHVWWHFSSLRSPLITAAGSAVQLESECPLCNGTAANISVERPVSSFAEPGRGESGCLPRVYAELLLQEHPHSLHSLLLFTFWRSFIRRVYSVFSMCLPRCSDLSVFLFP